jgi:hypothetical protein
MPNEHRIGAWAQVCPFREKVISASLGWETPSEDGEAMAIVGDTRSKARCEPQIATRQRFSCQQEKQFDHNFEQSKQRVIESFLPLPRAQDQWKYSSKATRDLPSFPVHDLVRVSRHRRVGIQALGVRSPEGEMTSPPVCLPD